MSRQKIKDAPRVRRDIVARYRNPHDGINVASAVALLKATGLTDDAADEMLHEPMTVRELIDALTRMPPDAVVHTHEFNGNDHVLTVELCTGPLRNGEVRLSGFAKGLQ